MFVKYDHKGRLICVTVEANSNVPLRNLNTIELKNVYEFAKEIVKNANMAEIHRRLEVVSACLKEHIKGNVEASIDNLKAIQNDIVFINDKLKDMGF